MAALRLTAIFDYYVIATSCLFFLNFINILIMGRKKYYCDFCNRYFNDDTNTRQKHLNSVGHINLKKEHYNMFRDPETLLAEEGAKKPCRKFHFEGFCPFGGSCTYSHYSKEDLNSVRQELLIKKQQQQQKEEATLESWLFKYSQSVQEKQEKRRKLLWSSELPAELLLTAHLLPPSLLPFHMQEFMNAKIESWG